ncbi:hypothetical protein ABZP36_025644 [Zizania latifolia]
MRVCDTGFEMKRVQVKVSLELEPMAKMELLGLLAVAVAAMILEVAGADSGWSSGRATFYGGSDASGTMGTYQLTELS